MTQSAPTMASSTINSVHSPMKEEAKHWFALALPLAATLLCRTGMMLTDVSVLGLWNSDYLGAAGVSSVFISLTSVIIWRGLLDALNTLCGQAYGAKNYKLVGEWLSVGLTLSLILSLIVSVSWLKAGQILQPVADIGDEESDRVSTFCRISVIGLLPFSFYCGLSNYLSTLHIIKPLLWINFISLMLNFALNWIFVRGVDGWFDGIGFPGSPAATASTRMVVFALTYLWIVYEVRKYPEGELSQSWPKSLRNLFCAEKHSKSGKSTQSLYKEYMAIATPIIISTLLEEAQVQVVGLMAARLGDDEMATHNAILQIFFVSSSFLWATAGTTQVRMSTHLGAGDSAKARTAMKLGTYVAFVCGASVAVTFMVAREHMAALYSNKPEVRKLTGEIAILVGLGYFGLSAFYVSLAVLSAQARPHFIAAAFFIGAWGVSVPAAYIFAFHVEKTKGLIGLWLGLTCGYCVVTIISLYGVISSDWDQVTLDAVNRSKRERRASETFDDTESRFEPLLGSVIPESPIPIVSTTAS